MGWIVITALAPEANSPGIPEETNQGLHTARPTQDHKQGLL
jgi:hypothetical protein